ncbi:MAG: hypothetical protein ABI581_12435, partial [Sediminibacterium sp.]
MKKLSLLLIVVFAVITVSAQTDSLLKWQTQAKKIGTGLYELYAKSQIPAGWYVYGSNPKEELEGPKFVPAYENAQLEGAIQYITGTHFVNDPTFHKVDVISGIVEIRQQLRINGFIPSTLKGTISAFLGRPGEFLPEEHPFEVTLEGGVDASPEASAGIKLASIDINKPLADCGKKNTVAGNSVWAIFLLGFLGGLIALLTPCVFPMIP